MEGGAISKRDLSIQSVPGLQTVWYHLTDHIKQDRKTPGNKGLCFVESITGMGSNPKRTEMDHEDTDPQTDPNICFQVVVRGWSNENQQTRAQTLLTLSVDKMVKSLQHQKDIILIPRHW